MRTGVLIGLFSFVLSFLAMPIPHGMAQSCDAVVEDVANVISEIGRVNAAANALAGAGATVRVRTFPNLPQDQLDKEIFKLRERCPTWNSGSSNSWKSTMLVFAYAPPSAAYSKDQIGFYFGTTHASRVGNGKWQDVMHDKFDPHARAFKGGEKNALTLAFVNTMTEFQAVLSRPSMGGSTTIHQATDFSGLWSAMKWFLLIAFLAVAGLLGWLFFRKKEDDSAAGSEARRVRSEAVSGINDITSESAAARIRGAIVSASAEKQAALEAMADQFRECGETALATLSQFDNAAGADPNKGLSERAYQSNQRRYEAIIRDYVTPAKRLLADIMAGRTRPSPIAAPAASPSPPPAAWARSSYMASPAPPVTERTVYVNRGDGGSGFVTGMLAGELLSDAANRRARENADEAERETRRARRREAEDSDNTDSYRSSGGSRRSRSDDIDDRGGSYSSSGSSGGGDSGGSYSSSDSGSSSSDSGGSSSSC